MSLLLRQFYSEMLKLLARKRTYMGFAAFFALETIILLLLQLPKSKKAFTHSMMQHGLDFSHYFSGLTLAYTMMMGMIYVLTPLYLALVCGDIVSKEVEDGTMRMLLSRPVSRIRVLLLKYLACVAYTWILTIFIVASSLGLGIVDRGLGGLAIVDPWNHLFAFYESGPGLERFGLVTLLLCLMMLTISSLGFMFSCFNMKPASATILTLSLFLFDQIIHNVPYFEDIKPYFLTHHLGKWPQAFQLTIDWTSLSHSVAYLGMFDLVFLFIGGVYFCRRDFKS